MDSKTKVAVDAFNQYAQHYSEKYADQTAYSEGLSFFVNNLIGDQPLVLDLACGPGNVATFLLSIDEGIQIKGIDLAPEMISIAQNRLPQGEFEVADCRNLDSIKSNFDGILCSFILPYINLEDSTELLEKSFAKLNNKGLLYLSTMEDDYSNSDYKSSSSGEGPKLFIHYYSLQLIKEKLLQIGFEILYATVQEFQGDNPSADRDLIVIARKP